MLPRLLAEESLREVTRTAIGGGHLQKDSSGRLLKVWEREAGLDHAKKTSTTHPDAARAAGITVKHVKKARTQ